MAVKYIIFQWNFDNFALIRLRTVTREYLRSPITNLNPESQNSKWRLSLVIVSSFLEVNML